LQTKYLEMHSKGALKGTEKMLIDKELKENKELLKKITKVEEPSASYGLFSGEQNTANISERLQKMHKELFSTSDKEQKKALKLEIEAMEWGLISSSLQELGKTYKLHELESLKQQNIKPYYDGLDQIKLINPIKFHYNDKSDYDTSKEYIGIIAQDLHEVAPYMVHESKKVAPDGSAYLEVDNSSMTYMLINAVKELAQQNEELKKLLATTRSSNEIEFKNLKAEIDDIKKQLLRHPTKTIKDFE